MERYTTIRSFNYFKRWIRAGGWKSVEDFEQDLGVSWNELQGIPFLIVNGRVFMQESTQ